MTDEAKGASDSVVRTFSTGATRDRKEGKFDYFGFVSAKAARRFGAYMHKNRQLPDGTLRSGDNWKQGIPIPEFKECMGRHVQEFCESLEDGDLMTADEAACAIRFNIDGWLHERVKVMDADNQNYPGKRVPGKPPMSYAEAAEKKAA